jgi:uncharacterized membrane protein YbhN (UPF0104 family)
MKSLRAGLPALLLNLVVLGLFAWAVEHYWGWGRLLAPWHQLDLAVLLLAIAGMLLSYGVRALRIYLAERDIPRGRYFACLRLILINNVVNLLLPARTGEASFPILMSRWFGIDAARATGTLIWLRLLDLHVLATVGAACAAAGWLDARHGLSHLAWATAGAAAVSPPLFFALRRPLHSWCDSHGSKPALLLSRVLTGLPHRYAGLALDLSLSWLSWGIKLAALSWVLSRLAQIPLALGTLGAIGGDLSTVLPVHAPGGFGTYEAGVIALLAPGATPSGELLAGAVNLHLLVLTTALLAGAAAWLAGTAKQPADAKLP